MRTYVTTLLETNGFKPLSAGNGEEGMAMARLEKPSLIILDVMMPEMSGIVMFHELKKAPDLKGIPVIMLSAISEKTFFHSHKILSKQDDEEIHQPAAYIEKPPEPEELLEAIENSLGRAE
jgi:two-component system phosphate regulon response regulator PhoB